MIRQIERRLRGEPLRPYTYRDFGSLVSLGKYTTVGNLMGLLVGRSIFIEGLFAKAMYTLPASAARTGAAWDASHRAGLARAQFVTRYRPTGQAALSGRPQRHRKDQRHE